MLTSQNKVVKRLAIILLSMALIAPNLTPQHPLPQLMEKWSCVDVLEIYAEAAALHQAAGERLKEVKSSTAKIFWTDVRQFTLNLHPYLLEARTRKCKAV